MRSANPYMQRAWLHNWSLEYYYFHPFLFHIATIVVVRYCYYDMPNYVCVIGAGVNGLSTAIQIQETYPAARVTIIADKFERDTLSDGAAGSFRPTVDYIPGVPRHLLK